MRKTLLLLLLLSTLGVQAQEAWIKMTSEAGNFSILTPDSLQYRVNEMDLPIGKLQYHIYFNQGAEKQPNLLYQISYCDYPEGSVHSDSTEFLQLLFAQNVDESAAAVNGKVIYQEDIQLRDYPGKLFKVHFAEDQAAIKTQLYMIENRYYALSVTSLRGKSINPDVDRFLETFKILEMPDRKKD